MYTEPAMARWQRHHLDSPEPLLPPKNLSPCCCGWVEFGQEGGVGSRWMWRKSCATNMKFPSPPPPEGEGEVGRAEGEAEGEAGEEWTSTTSRTRS
eukprot:2802025-Rhodomonas_salina.1